MDPLDVGRGDLVEATIAELRKDVEAERFTYDDLRRLVRAEGSYGVQTWAYADDENITQHGDADYSYEGPQPHAVTAARGQTFAYNAAGHLAAVTGPGPVPAGTWRTNPQGRLRAARRG